MSDYTPTTEEVRGDYANFQLPAGGGDFRGGYAEGLAEFDRWLATHDAEVRAAALAAQDTEEPADPRTAAHIACDCVPDLGPMHCHLCSDRRGREVPWSQCEAQDAGEPEWEYGWNWVSHPYTEAMAFSPQDDEQTRADFAAKTGRQISPIQMYRRTPAVSAGPWLPVEQEGETDEH